MQRLKIGIDAKRIFHNDTGLGNYSRTLVRNLAAQYPIHTYYLFTPTISDHGYASEFLQSDKYEVITSSAWPNSIWRTFRIPRIVDRLGLDIYHGLSHELPLTALPKRTKSIVTFHDLIYEVYPDLFKRVDQKTYSTKYRKSAKLADHIIAISQSTSKDLQRLYGISANAISVCYQSCNEAYLLDDRPHYQGDYLLYVGSIIRRKGLLQIAQALELLQPSERMMIKVVGSGGEYLGRVKDFIRVSGLEDWFDFVGHVDNADLIDIYYHARALLLPSIYEGFGIPIIEALAVATPVITSETSSLPEAAGPGGLLVDPKNPQLISQAIRIMIKETATVERLAQAGRQYVQERFTARGTTNRLMEVYKSVLAVPPKA